MKIPVRRNDAFIIVIVGLCAIISGIFLIRYSEAWFLIIIGWILVPVLIKKAYDRVAGGKTANNPETREQRP